MMDTLFSDHVFEGSQDEPGKQAHACRAAVVLRGLALEVGDLVRLLICPLL
jgi:hypothetical protein